NVSAIDELLKINGLSLETFDTAPLRDVARVLEDLPTLDNLELTQIVTLEQALGRINVAAIDELLKLNTISIPDVQSGPLAELAEALKGFSKASIDKVALLAETLNAINATGINELLRLNELNITEFNATALTELAQVLTALPQISTDVFANIAVPELDLTRLLELQDLLTQTEDKLVRVNEQAGNLAIANIDTTALNALLDVATQLSRFKRLALFDARNLSASANSIAKAADAFDQIFKESDKGAGASTRKLEAIKRVLCEVDEKAKEAISSIQQFKDIEVANADITDLGAALRSISRDSRNTKIKLDVEAEVDTVSLDIPTLDPITQEVETNAGGLDVGGSAAQVDELSQSYASLARSIGTTFGDAQRIAQQLGLTGEQAAEAAKQIVSLDRAGADVDESFRAISNELGINREQFDGLRLEISGTVKEIVSINKALSGSGISAREFADNLGLSISQTAAASRAFTQLNKSGADAGEIYATLQSTLGITSEQFDVLRNGIQNVSASTQDIVRIAQVFNTDFATAEEFAFELEIPTDTILRASRLLEQLTNVGASTDDAFRTLQDSFGLTLEQFESLGELSQIGGSQVVALSQSLGITAEELRKLPRELGLTSEQIQAITNQITTLQGQDISDADILSGLSDSFNVSEEQINRLLVQVNKATQDTAALTSIFDRSAVEVREYAEELGLTSQ
ncbi:MAG: hypothetical protein ACQ5SW_06460, partial [Sphaerochaetaceae bacterium]